MKMQICAIEKCTGCSSCSNTCQKKAIKMLPDGEGFLRPVINERLCVNCGFCAKVCPVVAAKTIKQNILEPIAYAAYNKNESVRLESSSGGVFTLLADYVLQNNGVVYGAAFDDQFMVHHIHTCDREGLESLRGSKYLQSNIGTSFSEAKKMLDDGRIVLFTGTPCQIEGLYSYLGKDYEYLYTQDIICHGVPSPLVWKRYVQYQEKQSRTAVQKIFFRHKNYGWKRYSVLFQFRNNTEYLKEFSKDLYMKSFLSNFSLRPSCYQCSFRTVNRKADITLADFWGIENVSKEMDDDKGTSLVILHSPKGKKLWNAIRDYTVSEEVRIADALIYNSAMTTPVSVPIDRNRFIQAVQHNRFDRCVDKYCVQKKKLSFKKRIKEFKRHSGIVQAIRGFIKWIKLE